ncbi:27904_t:CDS:2, partial [Dentiscutata erythropus]
SFMYKGKTYKTCANCLINKAKKQKKLDTDNTQPIIETISAQSICDYIENLISNVENNNRISFEIHIDLNDDIFLEVEPNDLKSIDTIHIPDLDSQQQSSTVFSADNDDERVDLDLYQQCEAKVVELEYLAKHLREKLSINNLKH